MNVVKTTSMRVAGLFVGLLSFSERAAAVYEDEAGMQEWTMQNVGPPTVVHFGAHHRLYVGSAAGVAGLSVTDGSVVWRHVGVGSVKDLIVVQKVVAVSVDDSVRAYKPSNGEYMWQLRGDNLQQLTSYHRNTVDEILVVRRSQLQLVGSSGTALVTVEASSVTDDLEFFRGFPVGENIGILCRKKLDTHGYVVVFNTDGKLVEGPTALARTPKDVDIFQSQNIRLIGGNLVVAHDNVVHSMSLIKPNSWSSLELTGSNFKFQGQPVGTACVVSNENDTVILRAEGAGTKIIRTLSTRGAIGVVMRDSKPAQDEFALATVGRQGVVVELLSASSGDTVMLKNEGIVLEKNGFPTLTAVAVSKNRKKVLVSTSDFSISLLDPEFTSMAWSRLESWATVKNAVMWQALPESIAAIAEGHDLPSIFSLMRDPTAAVLELQEFMASMQEKITDVFEQVQNSFMGTTPEVAMSQRTKALFKSLGAHKLAIASTCSGKIVAMDTVTRAVVWDLYLPVSDAVSRACSNGVLAPTTKFVPKLDLTDDVPVKLFLNPEPTGAVSESKAKVVVLHKESSTLYWIEPASGVVIHEAIFSKGAKKILKVSPMSKKFMNDRGITPVLVTTADQMLYVVPSQDVTAEMYESIEDIHSFEVSKEKNEVVGYARTHGTDIMTMLPIWNFNFGDEAVVAVTTPEHNSRDHVPVHVRGDASVLYKFINRNLLTIVTQQAEHGELVVHVIDAVTGRLLHRANIRGTTPVHVASCDNWVVVHYWSEDETRFEMAVMDFFKSQQDEGPWSIMFGSDNTNSTTSAYTMEYPVALEQSYIVTSGVSSLGVTSTAKGITPRSLVMALSSHQIGVMNKDLINSRRPVPDTLKQAMVGKNFKIPSQFAPTSDEQIAPYSPLLPMPTTQIVSLHDQVIGTRGIISSPTKLESTALVFAYGLDVFFTVVQPANAFDVLAPGFNYPLMYISMIAVTAALVFINRLAARKELKERWA